MKGAGWIGLLGAALAASPAAAEDELYYRLGGGEPISLGPTDRTTTIEVGIGGEWDANLMCGEFDVSHSIGQQLNGISGQFQRVMGDVIDAATGVVASLPALVIQRLNPGLYDLLQNGVLQASHEFRIAKLRCEEVTDEMGRTLAHEGWAGIAEAQYWRERAALGARDPLETAADAEGAGGEDGVQWVGGDRAGGAGQKEIEVVRDVVAAGYNQVLARRPGDADGVDPAACGDSPICEVWDEPAALADWSRRVLGEVVIRTCDGCEKLRTEAGLGLPSVYRAEKARILGVLAPLVEGSGPISQEDLDELRGGSGFRISKRLIDAVRLEGEPAAVANRLAGEAAFGAVMEQAVMARGALVAGMREPNVANNELALLQVERQIEQLDRQIGQMEMELRVRQLLASGTAVQMFDRASARSRVIAMEPEPEGTMREGAPE